MTKIQGLWRPSGQPAFSTWSTAQYNSWQP